MKRKLFSLLMSAFALLLLMGAGIEQKTAAALTLIEEEEVAAAGAEAAIQTGEEETVAVFAMAGTALAQAEVIKGDRMLLVNGTPASLETKRYVNRDVTYVSLRAMTQELNESASVEWNNNTGTLTVSCERLTITAKRGDLYLIANGRYLYVPEGIQMVNDVLMVPLKTICKAFDAQISWNSATGVTSVTSGSGTILSGDEFYNQDELFWLSRVIYAESGGEPLEGKMGVGIVVMNRVKHPAYPDTIQGVLAQKNQFATYKNGGLASRTPNASSVVAAKLVLDGGVVEEIANATYFDSASNSWASRNKTFVATIGGHKFYA